MHHYFGTKQDLFAEIVKLPIDPRVVLAHLSAAPLEDLGELLIRAMVGAWDSPAGAGLIAMVRGIVAGEDPALMRSFVVEVALKDLRDRVDEPKGTGQKRISLVATQMVGLVMVRKIVGIEPVASMSIDDIVESVGPTVQRYLTGPV